jgi:hypothetical protein
MLPLSSSDPLCPEFPPLMLDVFEVVDSPVKSPKCVSTQNGSVWQTGLSGFVGSGAVRGTVGSSEGVLFLSKWHLKELWWWLEDLMK